MKKILLTVLSILSLLSISVLNAQENKAFSLKPIGVKIENIKNNTSTINVGNLTVGQSGIVVHIINIDKKLIVANAIVEKSDENHSVIKFTKYTDLKQDALPSAKSQVKKGDIIVFNYLYTQSLGIAPNQESFLALRNGFKYNNFLHSDIFAAKLKINKTPYPTKKEIQDFAIKQNLGTIFIVVNKKIYVLDSKSFKVLTSFDYDYDTKDEQKPFYTRVKKIDEDLLTFSLKNAPSYEEHYKKVLGL